MRIFLCKIAYRFKNTDKPMKDLYLYANNTRLQKPDICGGGHANVRYTPFLIAPGGLPDMAMSGFSSKFAKNEEKTRKETEKRGQKKAKPDMGFCASLEAYPGLLFKTAKAAGSPAKGRKNRCLYRLEDLKGTFRRWRLNCGATMAKSGNFCAVFHVSGCPGGADTARRQMRQTGGGAAGARYLKIKSKTI
jgi:hypothetical protein